MLPRQTHGFSMRLHQPMKRVTRRRGMRLLNRKLMSSCCVSRPIKDLAVILVSFACNTVRPHGAYEESTIPTIVYVLAGIALAFLLRKGCVRLQLSLAKHRSLAGHARMSRPFAS